MIVKVTIMHNKYSSESTYFSIFLYKETLTYHWLKFYDDDGTEIESAIGLNIYQEHNSSNYRIEVVSHIKIENSTIFTLKLNKVQENQTFTKKL